jgi:cyanophycinase
VTEKIYTGGIPVVGRPAAGGAVEAAPEEGPARPIYLLADSQLLFWRDETGEPFLARVRRHLPPTAPKAAYVGASNGDEPAFYGIFTGAMESIGVTDCRMIPSRPSGDDLAFLETADLVLLAGGDVALGWRTMAANGVAEAVVRRHHAGAVLVGVSAGAVQLGCLGWPEGDARPAAVFPTFALVPYVVSAHAEDTDWSELRLVVAGRTGTVRGLGIPRGGGVACHPDRTVEALRHPAAEVALQGGEVAGSLLFPLARRSG